MLPFDNICFDCCDGRCKCTTSHRTVDDLESKAKLLSCNGYLRTSCAVVALVSKGSVLLRQAPTEAVISSNMLRWLSPKFRARAIFCGRVAFIFSAALCLKVYVQHYYDFDPCMRHGKSEKVTKLRELREKRLRTSGSSSEEPSL